ncbi:MAG: hypothetical protein E7192_02640 [Erysipelotrichaceae bacterium]|nr:hypothetical protein [Erysipelotrichaceae bacterium]
MKMHCDIISDLIPSYVDGVCSEKTKELVEEHLLECEQCRELVKSLNTDLMPEISQIDAKKPWQKIKRASFIKMMLIFVVSPMLLFGLFVGWCTLSGEGLSLDALMYRSQANAFLNDLSLSDYASASQYLSCYGSENVQFEQSLWAEKMEDLGIEFVSMNYSPLYADDGIAQTWVTAVLATGDHLEFRVMVQGDGLSVSSIYLYDNEVFEKVIQKAMTSHHPG